MKFTNGAWLMRPGVTSYHPVHVYQVEVEPDALTAYGPVGRLTHRGDTHDMPLLTVRFSSPMADVIRVQVIHHKGGRPRKPEFELQARPSPEIEIHEDAQAATLTSGRLTVRVEKEGDWQVEFKDGERVITSSGWRGMGFIDTEEGRYIRE